MQKLICKPGQRATIVRALPGYTMNQGLLGKVVRVIRLLSPSENLYVFPEYPCWKIEKNILGTDGREYIGVHDYCLAPLPDEGDVFEYDHEADFVREQNEELIVHEYS